MKYKRKIGGEYEFVDREGKLVRSTREGLKPVGKAYGFIDCKASREEIEAELPTIRSLSKTPSQLELSLRDGIDVRGDSKLMPIVERAKEAGIRYAIEATYPNATNRETADELAVILNQAYQSPLYQEGEKSKMAITFEENEKYVFKV